LKALFDEMNPMYHSSRTMRLLRILLVLLIPALAALAQTNTPVTRRMSLEDCVATALEHNLDVKIKRFNPDIAGYNLAALYGTYDPSAYLSAEHDDIRQPGSVDAQGRVIPGAEIKNDSFSSGFQGLLPWGLNYNLGISLSDQTTIRPRIVNPDTTLFTNTFLDINNGNNIALVGTNFASVIPSTSLEVFSGSAGFLQLRQPLLKNFLIDNTRLQILLDKHNVKISELDLRFQVMTTVFQVEQAYDNLIFAQENVKVQQKALELAERQLAENKKRVEVGAMAPLDEKQAASQVASSRADLLNALGTEETQQRALKSLLSDDYTGWANVVIQPAETLVAVPQQFDLQESWRTGLTQRPDFLQQKLNLEKQVYVVRYQKNQLLPQLDAVGTAGYRSAAQDFGGYLDQLGGRDNPFYSVGGQFSIPLGNNNARNNYRAAKASKEQIELQVRQLEQNIMIVIENDIAIANTRFQQVDATREARIYAEAALEAEQKKLESGKSTSFVVLQLTRDLTSARSAEISALANYNIALAQLALDKGAMLDRHRVSMQWK
jgi:outer membrane protein TolC